ncbi:MAG: CapA family protein [Candidatus Paceibacteria bacterium]
MSKVLSYRVYTVLVIILALGTLIFHVAQLHSFFISAYGIQKDSIFSFKLAPKKEKISVTTILFLGDVMLGRNVEFLSQINGVDYSTSRIVGELPKVDAVVANFESAMAIPHVRTRAYTTQFSTAVWMLPVLTELKITHTSLANNHTLDFGGQGYQNAVRELEMVDIVPFGHSTTISTSSVTVVDGPKRVGIIAINTIFLTPNEENLRIQIEALKKETDIQVAYIHWGDEYVAVHNPSQARFARKLIEMGIDVIVGHHPHVVQDIDLIDGALVFYSLGNFIFDQYFSTEVQEGYVLHVTAEAGGALSFSIIPVTSVDSRSQPRLMTDRETEGFLDGLAKRSNVAIKEAIRQNTLRLP